MKCHVKLPVNPAKQSLPRIIKSVACSAILLRKYCFNCYQVIFINVSINVSILLALSLLAYRAFVSPKMAILHHC